MELASEFIAGWLLLVLISAWVDNIPAHRVIHDVIRCVPWVAIIALLLGYISQSDEQSLRSRFKGFILLLVVRCFQVAVVATGAGLAYATAYCFNFAGDGPSMAYLPPFAAVLGGAGALLFLAKLAQWLPRQLERREAKQKRRHSEELRWAFAEKVRFEPFSADCPEPDSEQIAWWVFNYVRYVFDHSGETRDYALGGLCSIIAPLATSYGDQSVKKRSTLTDTEEFHRFAQKLAEEIGNLLFRYGGFEPSWLFPLNAVYGYVSFRGKDSPVTTFLTSDWREAIRMRLAEILNEHRHFISMCTSCFNMFVTSDHEQPFCEKCSEKARKEDEEEAKRIEQRR
jgi:hypothetical protein